MQSATILRSADAHIGENHASVTLAFADGSLGTLHYYANGHRAFAKERLTVFCQGKILELDNFRRLYGYGWSNFRKFNMFRQDKGHRTELREFLNRVAHGGPPLIPFESLYNVTQATFLAQQSALTGTRIDVPN